MLPATVAPHAHRREAFDREPIDARVCRIASPAIEVPLALCMSDHLPMSAPAQAVRAVVLELVELLELDAEQARP